MYQKAKDCSRVLKIVRYKFVYHFLCSKKWSPETESWIVSLFARGVACGIVIHGALVTKRV
jgi:hypothetical protein